MDHWRALLPSLAGDRRLYMEFLRESLPPADLLAYDPALFLAMVDHSLMLRHQVPCCAALEERDFREYVLYPRVNDEDIRPHRALFFEELYPRVEGLSMEDALLEANRWAAERATYQPQDERTAAPLTVYQSGSGRCGEESAFLVAALRSVGIPARQVYALWWSHCDDNHAWVEARCDGRWRFVGACEPEPLADRGWFNLAASRAMLVASRSFCDLSQEEERAGELDGVALYNHTARYAATRPYTFRVLHRGAPAPGARLWLSVLNGAGFRPLCRLPLDADGCARVRLGLGDICLRATYRGLWGEGICHGARRGDYTLELDSLAHGEWEGFDFAAPPGGDEVPPLTRAQREDRRRARDEAGALLRRRVRGFFKPAVAAHTPGMEGALRAARGNFDEIYAFLARDHDPLRKRLVHTLADKDLRDTPAELLEHHLAGALPYERQWPERLYNEYILCPRIGLEKLSPWRHLAGELKAAGEWEGSPEALWVFLSQRTRAAPAKNDRGLIIPPEAVWQHRRANAASLRVLFVALLRGLGIPARLNPADGWPQYWDGFAFRDVPARGQGRVVLSRQPGVVLRQGVNWALARQEEEKWLPLACPEGEAGAREAELSLPAGLYRVTTANRMPNGNQAARRCLFRVTEGESARLTLALRPYNLAAMLLNQAMPAFTACALPGGGPAGGAPPPENAAPAGVQGAELHPGECLLYIWLEVGTEPTEHVLAELQAAVAARPIPARVVFLLREEKDKAHPALAAALEKLPGARLLVGEWRYNLETVARQLYCDPAATPLAVLRDGRCRARFAQGGYAVGLVDLLARIAAHCGAESCETGTSGW